MKITPRKGYILVSNQDIVEEKKFGTLILPGEEKKKTYLRVESDGEFYMTGQCVFAQPFKTKMQIEENLFLMAEEDIVATFTLENKDESKVALGNHDFPTSNISTEWGGAARCMTSDGRNVNMAEELNRLEKELIE